MLCCVAVALWMSCPAAQAAEVASPDGRIVVSVAVDDFDQPVWSVTYAGEQIVAPSRLGMRFRTHHGFGRGMRLAGTVESQHDGSWEQPWGERRVVRDRYRELAAEFEATNGPERGFTLRVRVHDDGVGLRYEVPRLPGYEAVEIVDELTEFAVPRDSTAWWIPGRGWNRYEYLYSETGLSVIDRVHTPVTFRTGRGTHLAIHEAALVDYAAMVLEQQRPGVFEADLTPWSDGVRVRTATPFRTPWRTVQIAPNAAGLMNSDLILNLNEPNALGDVSWVEPGKYVGIWWAMHIRTRTWGSGPIHGATTKETKQYIDFAADNGFDGVLVEGWNVGWDGDWFNNGALFRFTEPYPDFDLDAVAQYALERGVRLVGHHETSGDITNYEAQMEAAFDLYESAGVRQVKTGYVADAGELERTDGNGVRHYEWHDGQFGVAHYLRALKAAAKRRISINTHEPIKDTGLRRTYPNWISREGARGQEFNAWGVPPNPPEHTAILPFTRMLAGPMDFTPGIFDLTFHGPDAPNRVQTTLAKQLALYVVLYSPIQMAADLPENYQKRPDAFRFIRDVPTDWEDSIALDGAVGDFVVVARRERGGIDWYLGALTNEEARNLGVALSFLEPGTDYVAEIYRDGDDAHWQTNPYAVSIEQRAVAHGDTLPLRLAAGGGAAIRFRPDNDE